MEIQTLATAPIQKRYDGFSLEGKAKQLRDNVRKELVIEAIERIHRSVSWPLFYDQFSVQTIEEDRSRVVFATSPDGKIVGYGVARLGWEQEYYIPFIAVEKSAQKNGVGSAILLRLFEKILKKGGERVDLDFRDKEFLCNFYQQPSIPYKIDLQRKTGGQYCNDDGTHDDKNHISYFLNEYRHDLI